MLCTWQPLVDSFTVSFHNTDGRQAGKLCLCNGTACSLWKQLEFLLVSWVHSALQHTQNPLHYASSIYRQTNQSNKWLCQWIGGHVCYPIYSPTATWPGQDCLAVHLWDEGFAQENNWDHCLFSLPILCFPWNMQTGFFYVIYGYTLTSRWIVVIYVNISFNSSRLGQNDHYFGRWQFWMHFF